MIVQLSSVEPSARLLDEARSLVERLDDRSFGTRLGGESAVGAQLRHAADFYHAFLDGLDAARIDYDTRKRDPLFETSRSYAARELGELAGRLRSLSELELERALDVRCEAAALPVGMQEWTVSSTRRELAFLVSHTVHHFALVRLLLGALGVAVPADFGFAPSTLACAR